MLWKNRRESDNVEDRRGISGTGMAVGGGLGSIVLVLLALLFGADPRQLLQQAPSGPAPGLPNGRVANP